MLEGCGLTCVRDGRVLFNELNLRLETGEILQVEGANGAGKTSLLRILCGLAQPREGTVYWQGNDINHCRSVYYHELLYIGHNPGIKQELTPLENLHFLRSLKGRGRENMAIDKALEQVGLYGYEDVTVRALSAGQRRRVALARLWLGQGCLWILDEPFTAIDRNGIRNLEAQLMHHVRCGGMVIITSHQMPQWIGCRVRQLSLG
jgi:heme exporter protein A